LWKWRYFKFSHSQELKSYSHRRLEILSGLFDFYKLLNEDFEIAGTTTDSSDFFKVTKVDNHIHLAGFLIFI
jgi:hypothetical protein